MSEKLNKQNIAAVIKEITSTNPCNQLAEDKATRDRHANLAELRLPHSVLCENLI